MATHSNWFELHGRVGKLAMSDVLAPASAYTREGFPLHITRIDRADLVHCGDHQVYELPPNILENVTRSSPHSCSTAASRG